MTFLFFHHKLVFLKKPHIYNELENAFHIDSQIVFFGALNSDSLFVRLQIILLASDSDLGYRVINLLAVGLISLGN